MTRSLSPYAAWCVLSVSVALTVLFPACAAETKSKRETTAMMTYPIGRFEIDVPKAFTLAIQTQKLRYAEVTETPWPKDVPREQARKQLWEARLAEINKLNPPEGKKEVVIEAREFPDAGEWAKGVFYYGSDMTDKSANWDLLIDTGLIGVWVKSDRSKITPTGIEKMIRNLTNIARAYTSGDPISRGLKGDWFYTRHGAINLPYLWQEETYARFEKHPLGLKLEFETRVTHQVEELGLIERTAAAITSGFAAGVDIERIRSRKRTLSGIPGDEEVDRMKSKDDAKLSFAWIYNGKKDSGNFPEIELTMESKDGDLDEKLKVWDAVLDSFKPVGQ